MVETEREQIGLMKAFGYGNLETASIYLKMAGVVGLVGVLAGGVVGGWLGAVVTSELAQYMRFPHLRAQFSWGAFAVAAVISLASALTGSLSAVRRAVRVSPAVAMLPPAPASFHRGLLERVAVWRVLDQPTRMIVRSLERFPARAALTAAGLSVSLSLLVGSQFMYGSLDDVVEKAYYRIHRWTDEMGFSETRDAHAMTEIAALPAVLRAEPIRTAPGRMRANARDERIDVVALDAGAELAHPLDAQGRRIAFKGRGVVLSTALAAHLAVRAGDTVELEVMEGRRPRTLLPVTAIADDYAGLTAYMDRDALNHVMGDGNVASGADLLVAEDERGDFYRAMARMPQAVGAASRADTVASFRSAVSAALTVEMTFFLGFAAAIAFGVAYNVSRIALADRARDLATLRVLGFDPMECAYILSGELLFLALSATPFGLLGGVALAKALATAFARQDFYVPFVISPRGLGLAFVVYLSAVVIAAALVVQRIWTLDLVSVLKTRE